MTIEEITKLVGDYQVYMNRKEHPPSSDEYNSNETFFNSTLRLLLLKLHRRGGNVSFVLRRVKHNVSTVNKKRDGKQNTGSPAPDGTEPSSPS